MQPEPPTQDVARLLLAEVSKLKAAGQSAISIDQLADWLARVPSPDERDRHFEWSKVVASLDHAGRLEMFKSVMEAGQTALKTLITINGGAAAALLAFLSNLLTKAPTPALQGRISAAMVVYVGGVALAGGSAACRYLAQFAGTHAAAARVLKKEKGARRWLMAGYVFTGIAIALGLGSLAAFCVGGWQSYLALRS